MSARTAEPVDRVRLPWVLTVTLVNLGTFAAFFGPLQALLPAQAKAFDPANKETVLAVVAGIGAAVSLVANPLFGALSDRTTSRFGRRVPWIFGGSVVGALGLLVLATANGIVGMILGWCLVQAAVNASLAAITATLPDRVPESQRALVGGYVGLGQTLGVLVGVGLAIAVGGFRAGYVACAAFLLISAVPYLRRSGDVAIVERTQFAWRSFVRSFWISPREHPDYAWAWGTRFLVNLGNAIATLYLLFYLEDEVKVDDPDGGLFVLITVYSLFVAATAVLAGRWSDRVGKRRIFVVVAGIVIAVAGMMLALWPTWIGALSAAIVLGIGFGAFMAVDLAIITIVLPDAASRGKDLGVINIANALPQVLAPLIAAPIVTALGGYRVLYVVAAVIGLIGSTAVLKIRSVA